jgi:Site-specific DNA methylase
MELKVLDLFCGMGGFSLGFAMEGFMVIAKAMKKF